MALGSNLPTSKSRKLEFGVGTFKVTRISAAISKPPQIDENSTLLAATSTSERSDAPTILSSPDPLASTDTLPPSTITIPQTPIFAATSVPTSDELPEAFVAQPTLDTDVQPVPFTSPLLPRLTPTTPSPVPDDIHTLPAITASTWGKSFVRKRAEDKLNSGFQWRPLAGQKHGSDKDINGRRFVQVTDAETNILESATSDTDREFLTASIQALLKRDCIALVDCAFRYMKWSGIVPVCTIAPAQSVPSSPTEGSPATPVEATAAA
ncbi:hypothetical protein SEPCBS119000_006761, partial [Sporothrix epigloea]